MLQIYIYFYSKRTSGFDMAPTGLATAPNTASQGLTLSCELYIYTYVSNQNLTPRNFYIKELATFSVSIVVLSPVDFSISAGRYFLMVYNGN